MELSKCMFARIGSPVQVNMMQKVTNGDLQVCGAVVVLPCGLSMGNLMNHGRVVKVLPNVKDHRGKKDLFAFSCFAETRPLFEELVVGQEGAPDRDDQH